MAPEKAETQRAEPKVEVELEQGVATIRWLVRRDTPDPRWVEMQVVAEDEESVRKRAWEAYDISHVKGVSPKKAMREKCL